MQMPLFDTVILGGLIVLTLAWPVFFFLIRRRTRETGRGSGWKHAAFFLGPVCAPIVFLLWIQSEKGRD